MKLLLDEMIAPAIAQQLCDRGHDVEAIKNHHLHEALSDSEVMELARSQGRAVVTNNLMDFRPLHYEAIAPGGPGHLGMVLMPGNYRHAKAGTGRIVKALKAKLSEFPGNDDLGRAETWL